MTPACGTVSGGAGAEAIRILSLLRSALARQPSKKFVRGTVGTSTTHPAISRHEESAAVVSREPILNRDARGANFLRKALAAYHLKKSVTL